MANPFINSSFTLRPSTNDRDKPELTLRQTEASRIRIPKGETTSASGAICNKGGRVFKRQRLFMDRQSLSTTFAQSLSFRFDGDYDYGQGRISDDQDQDQYISEEEYEYDTPIIRRRVSSNDFPSRMSSTSMNMSMSVGVSEGDYWKTRCLRMQDVCDETRNCLRESEEDQRQLRQRVRELEEQLLIHASVTHPTTPVDANSSDVSKGEGEGEGEGEGDISKRGDGGTGNAEGSKKKRVFPSLVVEIKENHQAVSSCFYLTDGEGLSESYDMEMEEEEEEDISMDDNNCDGMINVDDDYDDDRNDINDVNQQRG